MPFICVTFDCMMLETKRRCSCCITYLNTRTVWIVHSEDLRRWFIAQELDLFRYRFLSLTQDDVQKFLQLQNLLYVPVRHIVMYFLFSVLFQKTVAKIYGKCHFWCVLHKLYLCVHSVCIFFLSEMVIACLISTLLQHYNGCQHCILGCMFTAKVIFYQILECLLCYYFVDDGLQFFYVFV